MNIRGSSSTILLHHSLIAAIGLLLLLPNTAEAQTVIWAEDFAWYSDGTNKGFNGRWTSTCGGCLDPGDWFDVRSGMIQAADVNDWSVWESEVIDISAWTTVDFQLDAIEWGDIEGPDLCASCGKDIDYFDVYYSVDGGPYQMIVNWNGNGWVGGSYGNHTLTGDRYAGSIATGDWTTTTISQSGLAGKTLQIKVEIRNSESVELINLDNVIVQGNIILPIELISFTGEPMDQGTKISWTTGSNIDIDYYVLEKSETGQDFREIHRVYVAGDSHDTQAFRYDDPAPIKGDAYYRLHWVEHHGNIEYGPTILVKGKPAADLLVYPNLARNDITVDLPEGWSNELTHLRIFNIQGALQYAGAKSPGINGKRVSLDISDLAAGHYLLLAENHGQVMTSMIVKQ